MIVPLAASAASLLFIATATAAERTPYPLLIAAHGVRVYGPPVTSHVPCPHALPLPRRSAQTVRRAVALAMPRLFARLHENGRDAIVAAGPATRSGFGAAAGGCGQAVWRRSIVAFVRLPHVSGASLSQHTFAVARIKAGWVLWAWIH